MDPNSKLAQRVVDRFCGRVKTAGFPPSGFEQEASEAPAGPASQNSGNAGARNIPRDHQFDARSLKPMAKALWASSVALGHALAAYQHLSRMKSGTISPDGMLGGRGYVMTVKDARSKLFAACEGLSSIADTLFDEIKGPHWQPKLAQLDPNDAEDVSRFIEESDDILDHPEEIAERGLDEIEQANDGPGGTSKKKKKPDDEDEPEASELPTSGPAIPGGGPVNLVKQASVNVVDAWLMARKVQRIAQKLALADDPSVIWTLAQQAFGDVVGTTTSPTDLYKTADSSVNVDTLPGPRVNDLDRGNSTNPGGSFNWEDSPNGPSGNWPEGERDYDYHGEFENDLREAQSGLPSDDTPTEGYDFGLGYGARGQGAGGYANPSGEGDGTKGVWGPQSGLPGTPAQSSGDSTPSIDVTLNDRQGCRNSLPNDGQDPVARSDYFPGWKGNLVQSEDIQSESELPQGVSAPVDHEVSLVDTYQVHEDLATPYLRYDYTTHTYREEG